MVYLRIDICNKAIFWLNLASKLIVFLADRVDLLAWLVMKLQSVAISAISCLMQGNTGTTFSWLAILIFDWHDSVAEITLCNVEVYAVHRNKLSESYIICLPALFLHKVAKHEAATFGRVRMEINIHK